MNAPLPSKTSNEMLVNWIRTSIATATELDRTSINVPMSLARRIRDALRCLPDETDARRTAEYWKAEHLAGNAEIERLREGLKFYAEGHHMLLSDESAWDTVSGEPQNWYCDEAGTATMEDGTIAEQVLEGHTMRWDAQGELTLEPPRAELKATEEPNHDDPFKRCQHDLQKPGTTIVVDGTHDAKCMCCSQEWHLPPVKTNEDLPGLTCALCMQPLIKTPGSPRSCCAAGRQFDEQRLSGASPRK